MQRYRTAAELPNASEAQGSVGFVADRARIMQAAQGGTYADSSIGGNVRTVSAAGSLLKSDGLIILSGTGTYQLELPTPASFAGSVMKFLKTGASGVVTLNTPGSETINGSATLTVTAQYRTVELYSDGTNWFMLSNQTPAAG